MTVIPQAALDKQTLVLGLQLRNRGKVRDSYDIQGHPGKMLTVASNRCSIFDFVLNTKIPFKGQILTALSYFWTSVIISDVCETDLVACGVEIGNYLPENLRGDTLLQKHATVVKLLERPKVEDIVRLYLTGSGWTSYQKDQTVWGHKMPSGLIDGSKLPYPIYTPTTKAHVGHDEPITADSVAEKYGFQRERLSLQVAQAISSFAEKRGIILADTKFEFSQDSLGLLNLADEKGTPDSSRFWDAKAWEKAHAKGKLPPSFDKQYVREWGKKAFIEKDQSGRKRDPENQEDLDFVSAQAVPEKVVKMTTALYRYIFWRLTGMQIEAFQQIKMGIAVMKRRPKIEIIIGSGSDLSQTGPGFEFLRGNAEVNVSIISCHRNYDELNVFVKERLRLADIVIAGAGKAAALPGMAKSQLCAIGCSDIPVIGVAFAGSTVEDSQAAKSSIECLPEQPVELDSEGKAYFGPEGFLEACNAAINDEFLPKTIAFKAAQIDIRKIS